VVELSAVLARYRPRDVVVNHVNEIVKHVNLVEYEKLHEVALDIGSKTCHILNRVEKSLRPI